MKVQTEEGLKHQDDKMTSNAYVRRYSQAIFRMALENKDIKPVANRPPQGGFIDEG